MKEYRIDQLFTAAELKRAVAIYNKYSGTGEVNRRLKAEIVEAAMPRINALTKQENDAGYMAYALEYALMARPPRR